MNAGIGTAPIYIKCAGESYKDDCLKTENKYT